METETFARATARTIGKIRPKQRGVFEKDPGSGTWWIRYIDAQGRYRREKAGTKGNAKDLYTKRKNEALAGKKLPEKLRARAVSFGEIADDAISYVKTHYSRPADDVARLEVLKGWFLASCRDDHGPSTRNQTRSSQKREPLGTRDGEPPSHRSLACFQACDRQRQS